MTMINAINRVLARQMRPGLGECPARALIKWPRWPLASLASAASCAALLLAPAALAQSLAYPDHPVKIIVPFPAAGPTDVVARLIAQKLSDKWGQQFYIENMSVPAAISAWGRPRGRRPTAIPSCSCRRATRSTRISTPSRPMTRTGTSRP